MNQVQIVTDSTADLPEKLVKDHNIAVVPLKVIFNGKDTYRDDVDISTEQFYQRLVERRETATTSQPTPGEFVSVYPLSAKHHIHTYSSVMSGTCQSADCREMVSAPILKLLIQNRSVWGSVCCTGGCQGSRRDDKRRNPENNFDLQARLQVFYCDSLSICTGRQDRNGYGFRNNSNIKPFILIKAGPALENQGKTKAIERA